MNRNKNQARPTASLVFVFLTLAVLTPLSSAGAQTCTSDWARPFVCSVRVGVGAPGERLREIRADDRLSIPARGSLNLVVQGLDQFGRSFPSDRMRPGLSGDSGCSELVTWETQGDTGYELVAGSRRGSCRLLLWIPGNLNLEWVLNVEVISAVADGYTRSQAETMMTFLYRGILGRDPDPSGLQNQVAEILRGRLRDVVVGMYASSEFLTRRNHLTPIEQLDQLYQALLGREVDSSAVRTYLSEMERGRYPDVALHLLSSSEFEDRLLDAVN